MSWKQSSARRAHDPRRRLIERLGYGDNWPEQRRKALERDDHTCQKCGYKGRGTGKLRTVFVHHRRKIAWYANSSTRVVDYEAANNLDNLITLCNKCHRVADRHAKMRGFVYVE